MVEKERSIVHTLDSHESLGHGEVVEIVDTWGRPRKHTVDCPLYTGGVGGHGRGGGRGAWYTSGVGGA